MLEKDAIFRSPGVELLGLLDFLYRARCCGPIAWLASRDVVVLRGRWTRRVPRTMPRLRSVAQRSTSLVTHQASVYIFRHIVRFQVWLSRPSMNSSSGMIYVGTRAPDSADTGTVTRSLRNTEIFSPGPTILLSPGTQMHAARSIPPVFHSPHLPVPAGTVPPRFEPVCAGS